MTFKKKRIANVTVVADIVMIMAPVVTRLTHAHNTGHMHTNERTNVHLRK